MASFYSKNIIVSTKVKKTMIKLENIRNIWAV